LELKPPSQQETKLLTTAFVWPAMLTIRRIVLSFVIAASAIAGTMAEEPAMSVALQDEATVLKSGTSDDTSTQSSDVPAGLMLTGDAGVLKGDQAEGDDVEQATDKNDNVGALTFGGDEPPADLTLTGERDMLTSPDTASDSKELVHEQFGGLYRRRFFYPRFRGGYYGWRYPLPYWRRYGRRFYRGPCPFGRIYGGYYYC
jgi:hypothetical protein